jgi:hypothetical protein
MKVFNGCVIVGLSLVLPWAASAQSDDAKYCASLTNAYKQYVGPNEAGRKGAMPDASIKTAMDKCDIPVLEKALKDAKVDLPKRG